MSDLQDKLFGIADRLESTCKHWEQSKHSSLAANLQNAAEEVGKSWSGSWLGYQARVYYANFQTPPAGAHFSRDWGLRDDSYINDTTGDWREYKQEDVTSYISQKAGVDEVSLNNAADAADKIEEEFEHAKGEFLSLTSIAIENQPDAFLEGLRKQVEETKIFDASTIVRAMQPSGQFITHDTVAASEGSRVPPHFGILAHLFTIKQPANLCEKLAKLSRRAASHIEVSLKKKRRSERIGTNVFIGHGGSSVWKDLKDFVQDRLNMPWDEFNRVPVAGISNIARLSQMLDEAAIAFLVMTAEDEQKDGKIQARMNVIHEAGLFQGRLGFSKAIIILEEGCEEFTNIQGLGQIRFPKGKIKMAFEDVRRVLEREGLIES